MSAATVLSDVASGIATRLGTVSGLKVYSYDVGTLDSLPAACVGGPSEIVRSDPDAGDSQVGSLDWHTVWPVILYVAFDNPSQAASDARALLGQVIAAVDADRSLGLPGTVLDASLVRSTYRLSPAGEAYQHQTWIWDCELAAWLLI